MDKKQVLITIIIFLLSCLILLVGRYPSSFSAKILGINDITKTPKQLYQVYLEGKKIGIIKSKQELEDYIDMKQQEIKDKYNVDKVYAPNDLDIIKEITYNEKISTVEEIYKRIEKIKGESSFTMDGYKIVIKGLDKQGEEEIIHIPDQNVYVLDKDIFTNSVNKTITAFIDKSQYDAYINDSQKKIGENETGTIIEKISIDNEIVIKQERIPTGVKIYQSEEELSRYLLFGTTSEQETYVVKEGDTIEEISNDNRLSTEEFLIANPSFKTANDLLYPGQVVNLGLINPQFDLVEVVHEVSKQEKKMEIVYKNDDTQFTGYEKVEQEGQDGLSLVTRILNVVNGEVIGDLPVSEEVLIPPINKIIVRGTKKYVTSYDPDIDVPVEIGSWVWPTNSPYWISSPFSWRWGKHHDGIDITGSGYGSPIKAANNGIVVVSEYTDYNGNWISIKHSNGYYTAYAHMASRTKKVGDIVMANDVIGTMGATGYATGVHLHFGLYQGYPFRGGVAINPMTTIY